MIDNKKYVPLKHALALLLQEMPVERIQFETERNQTEVLRWYS